MRNQRALYNIVSSLLLQVSVAISGLLLPRFYLITYGSAMNGMVSSVTQFMAYLALVEAGIGLAAIAELYGPLARKNVIDINAILIAARKFYRQAGCLYTAMIVCLVTLYPHFIGEQVSSGTTRSLILILSACNLVDYFFIGHYRILLIADQKSYVFLFTQIISTVFNTGISIMLMIAGWCIVSVKFVATFTYIVRVLVEYAYIKKQYPYIDLKPISIPKALPERWSVWKHQLATIALNNTNIILLTLFLGANSLLEISVYTIYQMIGNLIITTMSSFANALSASFGEVIAQKDKNTLFRAYDNYEFVYQIVLACACTCLGTLYLPFIRIYTANIVDINYIRPMVMMLFTLIVFFQCIRVPGITIICAAGHYRQTQKRACIEALINITIALFFVKRYGTIGVLAGTLCAYTFSSIHVLWYCNKYLIPHSIKTTLKRLMRISVFSCIEICLLILYGVPEINEYRQWLMYAVSVLASSLICIVIPNALCEPKQCVALLERIKSVKLPFQKK